MAALKMACAATKNVVVWRIHGGMRRLLLLLLGIQDAKPVDG